MTVDAIPHDQRRGPGGGRDGILHARRRGVHRVRGRLDHRGVGLGTGSSDRETLDGLHPSRGSTERDRGVVRDAHRTRRTAGLARALSGRGRHVEVGRDRQRQSARRSRRAVRVQHDDPNRRGSGQRRGGAAGPHTAPQPPRGRAPGRAVPDRYGAQDHLYERPVPHDRRVPARGHDAGTVRDGRRRRSPASRHRVGRGARQSTRRRHRRSFAAAA